MAQRTLAVASTVLALLGVTLGVFGWWGLYTTAGSRHFDEMAGLIPFFAGIAGAITLLAATLLAIWRYLLASRK